jgi:hypothetical protein
MEENPVVKQKGNKGPHRWAKGESGNPRGRPKEKTLTEIIRAKLAEIGTDGLSRNDALAQVFVSSALAGDFKFAKEVLERIDGKVPDRIAGPDGGSFTIHVRYDDLDPAQASLGPADDPQGDEAVQRGELREAVREDDPR